MVGEALLLTIPRAPLALSRTPSSTPGRKEDDAGLTRPHVTMAARCLDFPQGSHKQHVLATLGTLDIDPDIRPYVPGSRDHDPGCNHGPGSNHDPGSNHVGVFCKNILLKDRKGQFYLITFHEEKNLDLKRLRKDLGAHRNFSFASRDELLELLRVPSGAVSPFALMFDSEEKIKFVMDADLVNCQELLNFHPMDGTETCLVTLKQLQRFLQHIGREITTVLV